MANIIDWWFIHNFSKLLTFVALVWLVIFNGTHWAQSPGRTRSFFG